MCKKNLLILLVGENPLPNYIVAKYLLTQTDNPDLEKPTDIMYIYSNQTSLIYDKLEKAVNNINVEKKIHTIPLNIKHNQNQLDEIIHEVEKKWKGIKIYLIMTKLS